MTREQAENLVEDLIQAAEAHARETVARKYTLAELTAERAKVISALMDDHSEN